MLEGDPLVNIRCGNDSSSKKIYLHTKRITPKKSLLPEVYQRISIWRPIKNLSKSFLRKCNISFIIEIWEGLNAFLAWYQRNIRKGVWDFFILFRSWVINKSVKNECIETRSFLILQITQDLKKIDNDLKTMISRKRVRRFSKKYWTVG